MFPHHKSWAIKRTLNRVIAFGSDVRRGRLRGCTEEEVHIRVGFYRANIHPCIDKLDIKITSMHRLPSTDLPYTNFAFKCLQCGHHEIRVPDDRAPEGMVSCPACARDICAYGELTAALSFIAVDEYRYGEPDKYLQEADNEDVCWQSPGVAGVPLRQSGQEEDQSS